MSFKSGDVIMDINPGWAYYRMTGTVVSANRNNVKWVTDDGRTLEDPIKDLKLVNRRNKMAPRRTRRAVRGRTTPKRQVNRSRRRVAAPVARRGRKTAARRPVSRSRSVNRSRRMAPAMTCPAGQTMVNGRCQSSTGGRSYVSGTGHSVPPRGMQRRRGRVANSRGRVDNGLGISGRPAGSRVITADHLNNFAFRRNINMFGYGNKR